MSPYPRWIDSEVGAGPNGFYIRGRCHPWPSKITAAWDVRCVASVAPTPKLETHNPSTFFTWITHFKEMPPDPWCLRTKILVVWPGRDALPKARDNVPTKASVYVNQQLCFHFVEDPGMPLQKMDLYQVCVSFLQILWSCFYHATFIDEYGMWMLMMLVLFVSSRFCDSV